MNEHPLGNLTPPPRNLPSTMELYITWGRTPLLLGFLMICAGLLIIYAILFHSIRDHFLFKDNSMHARGRIVRITYVGDNIRSRHSRRTEKIFQVDYTYQVKDGEELEGTVYVFGKHQEIREGKEITVDYVKTNPEISKIPWRSSYRNMPSPIMNYLGWIGGGTIGVLGLILVFRLWGQKSRLLHLLKNGKPVMGELVNIKTVGYGKHSKVFHVHQFPLEDGSIVEAENENFQQSFIPFFNSYKVGNHVPMLYDPSNPHEALPLSEFPKLPVVDFTGYFHKPDTTTANISFALFILVALQFLGLMYVFFILNF